MVFTKKLRFGKCVGACLKVAPLTLEKFGFLKNQFFETFYKFLFFDLKDFKKILKKPSKKFTRVFMVFMVFIKPIDMTSIKQQIIKAKKEKREREEELWFVDYCNNCKTGLASKCDVPCHHPWYCWHEGEAAIVQSKIVRIDEYRRLHRHVTSQMYWEYKELRKRQRQLIWKGRRELLK